MTLLGPNFEIIVTTHRLAHDTFLYVDFATSNGIVAPAVRQERSYIMDQLTRNGWPTFQFEPREAMLRTMSRFAFVVGCAWFCTIGSTCGALFAAASK
jgi:hypothetical protein